MWAFPSVSVWSLWIILVLVVLFAFAGMAIGNKLRGDRIENKEDHANAKTDILSMLPLLSLLVVCIFTPIVTGTLFWVGCALIVAAGVMYILSIRAFVKARRGVTTVGIYRLSRNPMYVAMFMILAGFALMAWSASPIMGLLAVVVLLWNTGTTHWMILGEERFLEGRYGETYLGYKRVTPRYLLF
jgi:protein-S-isoprenylcysteine O-methyltransferase Ste14